MTVATRHYSYTCSTMQESSVSTPHVLSLLSVLVTILHFHSWNKECHGMLPDSGIKLHTGWPPSKRSSRCHLRCCIGPQPSGLEGFMRIIPADCRHVFTFDQARRCIFTSKLSTFWLPQCATWCPNPMETASYSSSSSSRSAITCQQQTSSFEVLAKQSKMVQSRFGLVLHSWTTYPLALDHRW